MSSAIFSEIYYCDIIKRETLDVFVS